jgi:uncharacterized protein with GYD domain
VLVIKLGLNYAVGAVLLSLSSVGALAQTPPSPDGVPGNAAPLRTTPSDAILLTVFLKHDQSKTLGQINEELRRNGYYEQFPPAGIDVVSWYVVMGIGQIVTLRVPPDRLREVNRVLEDTAWGAYRTEFYPAYDYKAAAEQQRRQMQAKPK